MNSSYSLWAKALPWALCLLLLACGGQAPPASESLAEARDDSPAEHLKKHRDPKYVCPMHPRIIRDEPGNCPICGMTLVPREIEREPTAGPEVKVSGAMRQAMNLRTAKAERRTLWKYIRTLGLVSHDERTLVHVHPRAAGWVERLEVRSEGEAVRQGQDLLQLFSPNILEAQVDYLTALSGAQSEAQTRQLKAKNRLLLLSVPEDVIAALDRDREIRKQIPLRAPAGGVVFRLNIREGMYVTPDSEIMTLADLSRVWVMVDVFEHQLDWIKPGLSAEMTTPALPGRTWEGRIDYVYPELDPKTRTLRVRLVFDNPDGALKPNLFADVVLYGGPKKEALSVPREALILEGDRSAVVKVVGDGAFAPVPVVTGMRTPERVEILSGLAEGDEIVSSGQFLIDSEASIQASFARMGKAGGEQSAPAHQH